MKLIENADKTMKVLSRKRMCFLIDKIYMIVDTYTNIDCCPSLLKILTESETKDLKVPKVLDIIRDVTDIKEYNNANMAKPNWIMPEIDRKVIMEENSDTLKRKSSEKDHKMEDFKL